MVESLQDVFASSGFVKGKLWATRVEGFPRVEKEVELCGEGVEASEADEFRVVVRLVECRWQADEKSNSGSLNGSGELSTGPTPAPPTSAPPTSTPRRRSKNEKAKVRPKDYSAEQEIEVNLDTDEMAVGYFCRFTLQTLAVQLNNKPNRRIILNTFRKKVQPLWTMWLRHRITKHGLIAHVCRLYENEVGGGEKTALVSLFTSWYFAFCRSRRRMDRNDDGVNLLDIWR
mmetsp:Transcript_11740/g.35783  ORF Transcript_11740/g.35783 Transcript_11740/m.35783 type:complete len:230 (-) Transcript_11740:247-936(-)